MKVLLAGASGAIGLPLVRELRERGHEVIGLTRSSAAGERLRALGAQPLIADAMDRDGVLRAVEGIRADAVIHELTALKRIPTRHSHLQVTDALRRVGTANLIEVARAVGARRILVQSFFAGYGFFDHGPHVLTEDDEFAPATHDAFAPHVAALRAAEEQAFGTQGLEGIALRYAGFYGPGAGTQAMVELLRGRRLPIPRDGGGVLSWVYINDAASATVAALERGRAGQAYNIADDEPVSWRAFLAAVAETFGTPFAPEVPRAALRVVPFAYRLLTSNIRLSNAKAKRELGWLPSAPTYREGIARTFAALTGRQVPEQHVAAPRVAMP